MEQSTFSSSPCGPNEQKIRVIIVDDQKLLLETLPAALSTISFIEVAGVAMEGYQALEMIAEERPDVVIADVEMPEMDGIELTKEIRRTFPEVRVIGLTAFDNEDYVEDMMKAGASGFLLKCTSKNEVAQAVKVVMEGGKYFSEPSFEKLLGRISNKPTVSEQARKQLTEREQEIVKLICGELTNKEIADKLCLTVKTVEKHRNKMYGKIGVKNMAGLVKYAVENGLIAQEAEGEENAR